MSITRSRAAWIRACRLWRMPVQSLQAHSSEPRICEFVWAAPLEKKYS